MHTKQWMSSEQSNIAEQGLLGCGGHGCLGLFERHEHEVVGSRNRSILHLGASDLKVISMIYAPPYLMRRRNRRCSRSQARIISKRYPRKHTRRKHWKRQSTSKNLLLRSNHDQASTRRQHETTHHGIASIVERG